MTMSKVAPHTCDQCGEAAYIPFGLATKCVSRSCPRFDQDLWVEWVMEESPEEPQVEFDLEVGDDEPTLPQLKIPTLKDMLNSPYSNQPGPFDWAFDEDDDLAQIRVHYAGGMQYACDHDLNVVVMGEHCYYEDALRFVFALPYFGGFRVECIVSMEDLQHDMDGAIERDAKAISKGMRGLRG